MPYVIQAQEQDLPYELFEHLAEIMDESPDLTFADATLQLRHSFGIISVPSKSEAERLSTRFAAVGFPNSVLDALLEVPVPQPLNLQEPKLPEPADLAIVARLDTVTEHQVRRFNPWNIRMYRGVGFDLYLPGSGTEQWTAKEEHLNFYLDLFTRAAHWRLHSGSPLPLQEFLKHTVTPETHRSAAVEKLLNGDRNLLRFQHEEDYDKHVKWLYQVRYGRE